VVLDLAFGWLSRRDTDANVKSTTLRLPAIGDQRKRLYEMPNVSLAREPGLEVTPIQPEWSIHAMLGAPCRAGAAHIMQFWPVNGESGGKESTPECPEFRKALGVSVATGLSRRGDGIGTDRRQDAASLFCPGSAAGIAFLKAELAMA